MTTHVGAQTLERTDTQTTAVSRTKVVAGSRMFFIDNLRVFLTILVVIFHLAITYGAEGSWFYRERPTTEIAAILLTLFVILNQFYFMGLFFLISGYFVPGAVDRKGGLRFIKDRLIRLGIPLLLYGLLVSPYVEYLKGITEGYYTGSLGKFYLGYWQNLDFAPGPLWFVEVLLVFSIVYVLGRAVWSWIQRRFSLPTRTQQHKPLTHIKIIGFVIALAILTFSVRLTFPTGYEWNHLQISFFPQYILMFAVGILAYRYQWLPDLPSRVRKIWSLAAPGLILMLPVMMILGDAINNIEPFTGGFTWQSMWTSSYEAVYCVAMSILMLGLFRQRFDHQGAFSKFLSRNAYSVYIIHPLVIVPLAMMASSISIDPLMKFVLLTPFAVGLCFLGAVLLRRIPYSERVL